MTRVFPCGFDLPCDGYACSKRAAWFIGEERNHFVVAKLCEDCMQAVVKSFVPDPDEEPEPPPEDPVFGNAGGNAVSEKDYICSECGQKFESSQKLANHVRYKHHV